MSLEALTIISILVTVLIADRAWTVWKTRNGKGNPGGLSEAIRENTQCVKQLTSETRELRSQIESFQGETRTWLKDIWQSSERSR